MVTTVNPVNLAAWYRNPTSPIYDGNTPLIPRADFLDSLYDAKISDNNTDGEIWWDPVNGSNGNTGLNKGQAYQDVETVIANMSAGTEAILVNGDYSDSNADMMKMRINDAVYSIVDGASHTQRSIFRAETRFGVTLNFNKTTEDMAANGAPVRLEDSNFIWIDGFKVRMLGDYSSSAGDPPACFHILPDASGNTITRCSARRNYNTNFGGGFFATGSDLLLQDIFGCGATRYGIQGGGGLSSTQQDSIFRRCLWRTDFDRDDNDEPHGGIVYYGSNSNANGNHDYQNCIAINGNRPPEENAPNGMYGGIYTTHAPLNVNGRGCIIIDWAGRFAGWYMGGSGGADVIGLYNSLILNSGAGSEANQNGISAANLVTNQTLDHLTVGGWNGDNIQTGGNVDDPTNSLLLTGAEAAFNPLLLVDGDGCEIKYMIGEFMSRYGDAGYNTPQTNMRLWPYPYEDEIKDEFLVSMPAPTGYSPTNIQTRGFCASNLTQYIHEILGATLDLDGFYS